MATINVGIETEHTNHWAYEVQVDEGDQRLDYRVTLGFADYDLWSHGRVAPEKVVRAAIQFLLEREEAPEIKSKFDCSIIRRYFPEVDGELPAMI